MRSSPAALRPQQLWWERLPVRGGVAGCRRPWETKSGIDSHRFSLMNFFKSKIQQLLQWLPSFDDFLYSSDKPVETSCAGPGPSSSEQPSF